MTNERKLMGIGIFASCIIRLIAAGEHEPITVIEKHLEDMDLVEYLAIKYSNYSIAEFNGNYDNYAINFYFYDNCDDSKYRARKLGIEDADDGLLLLLAVLMERVERESVKWTIKTDE